MQVIKVPSGHFCAPLSRAVRQRSTTAIGQPLRLVSAGPDQTKAGSIGDLKEMVERVCKSCQPRIHDVALEAAADIASKAT
jgi:selenophosphate synthetase-related protein